MREIKFRAFAHGEMCYDVELSNDGWVHWWGKDGRECQAIGTIHDNGILKQCYLMQFTGLLDKSGKEIYEGDIVKGYGYEVRNGHQIRPERIFAINDFIKDTYRLLCITEGTGETVEVIGNIYENPDLL